MSIVQYEKDFCIFVGGEPGAGNGSALAGGCTEQYLKDNDYDVSDLFAADDGSCLESHATQDLTITAGGVIDGFDTAPNDIFTQACWAANVRVGMCIYIDSSSYGGMLYEITAINEYSVTLGDWDEEALAADFGAYVGGAWSAIEDAVDEVEGSSFNCFLYTCLDETLTAVIYPNGGSVSTGSMVIIRGYSDPTNVLNLQEGQDDYVSAFEVARGVSVAHYPVLTRNGTTNMWYGSDPNICLEGMVFSGSDADAQNVVRFIGDGCSIRNCFQINNTFMNGFVLEGEAELVDDCYIHRPAGARGWAINCGEADGRVSRCFCDLNGGARGIICRTVENCVVKKPYVWAWIADAVSRCILYDPDGTTYSAIDFGNYRHLRRQNNIIVFDSDKVDYLWAMRGYAIEEDYNCYWDIKSVPMTLAAFSAKAFQWYDDAFWTSDYEYAITKNGIYTDPLLVDPANNDFRLQPKSPCIGTGTNGTNIGIDQRQLLLQESAHV